MADEEGPSINSHNDQYDNSAFYQSEEPFLPSSSIFDGTFGGAYAQQLSSETQFPATYDFDQPLFHDDSNVTASHQSFDTRGPSHSTPQFSNFPTLSSPQCSSLPLDPSTKPPQTRRSLPRRRSKYSIPRHERQSMPIPSPRSYSHYSTPDLFSNDPTNQLDPLQRWRHSPPENEAASLFAIQRALSGDTAQQFPQDSWIPQARPLTPLVATPSGNFRGYRQTSSAASSDSGASGSSLKTTASARSRNRSRLKARKTAQAKDDKESRRYKCTFCCDDFRTKYDWTRHEKSLHLDLEEWQCAPEGIVIFSEMTGRIHCAYCNALDPSHEHLKEHNYETCDDPEQPTKFHRKDHLVQHLRLAHQLKVMPLIDNWKVDSGPMLCRCGFCDTRLNGWDERTAHLAEHFKKGLSMSNWRGDHDFDPSTAAKIRNAIPPYIIGEESHAIIPFRAADLGTQDHFNQISSFLSGIDLDSGGGSAGNPGNGAQMSNTKDWGDQNQTSSKPVVYLDMLTRHLGRFAREQIMLGIVPTDEMFQREARRVVYDGDPDGWNQTVADNEDWLTSFKGQLNNMN